MRRKWLRIALWVLLTPIILFIILMILLYVPPVQNLIRKQATAIASDATGMDISVERIDLRFPLNLLVRGVLVVQPADSAVDVQHPDTLLNLGSLNVRVQAWPLLKGKVEVDDITLKQVAVNSSNLMEGMCMSWFATTNAYAKKNSVHQRSTGAFLFRKPWHRPYKRRCHPQ